MRNVLILVVVSYVFLILGNGFLSLTNPDEVFYVQTTKEMLQRNSWMTPYLFGQPQFEKPILTYWLLRVGLAASGVSGAAAAPATPPALASHSINFASRFFPAVFAIIGVVATYFLARLSLKSEKKALLSAFVLASSGLYIGLARTVYTDMIFSIFILLALAAFYWAYADSKKRGTGVILFYVFSALAVLTKGPLGFGIPFLVVAIFLALRRQLRMLLSPHSLWGLAAFLIIALPWYVFVIHRFGNAFTHEFFYNDHIRRIFEAEHPQNDRWYFYPGSIILGMFPWSVFVLTSFVQLVARAVKRNVEPLYPYFACWIFVMFLFFQPAHSKLVSYIFPVFPVFAIMIADQICDWVLDQRRAKRLSVPVISCVTLALIPLGLVSARKLYYLYLPSTSLVGGIVAFFVGLLAIMLILAARRKFLASVYVLGAMLPVLFFLSLLSRGSIDPYLSSESACRFLLKNHVVDNTILCSKYFSRGVFYYTGKNVAVIEINGSGFFSPHPIPYLDTREKVREFLGTQSPTYCIVDDSSLRHLRDIVEGEMTLDVETKTGNEYVVRVDAEPLRK